MNTQDVSISLFYPKFPSTSLSMVTTNPYCVVTCILLTNFFINVQILWKTAPTSRNRVKLTIHRADYREKSYEIRPPVLWARGSNLSCSGIVGTALDGLTLASPRVVTMPVISCNILLDFLADQRTFSCKLLWYKSAGNLPVSQRHGHGPFEYQPGGW